MRGQPLLLRCCLTCAAAWRTCPRPHAPRASSGPRCAPAPQGSMAPHQGTMSGDLCCWAGARPLAPGRAAYHPLPCPASLVQSHRGRVAASPWRHLAAQRGAVRQRKGSRERDAAAAARHGRRAGHRAPHIGTGAGGTGARPPCAAEALHPRKTPGLFAARPPARCTARHALPQATCFRHPSRGQRRQRAGHTHVRSTLGA